MTSASELETIMKSGDDLTVRYMNLCDLAAGHAARLDALTNAGPQDRAMTDPGAKNMADTYRKPAVPAPSEGTPKFPTIESLADLSGNPTRQYQGPVLVEEAICCWRALTAAQERLVKMREAFATSSTDEERRLRAALDAAESALAGMQNAELPVRLALKVLLNHIEPGWENCKNVIELWLAAKERS